MRTNRRLKRSLVLATALAAALAPPAASPGEGEIKAIFRQRCAACHTYGRGMKVGPDLKGVTQRRSRPWLLRFIRSSSSVIQSGDSAAVRLFREFRRQRMPDSSDLSPDQIGALLDYLAANGPEQKEADERHASSATAADSEMGRRLFHGEAPLSRGGRACRTCHRGGGEPMRGGTLGADLTTVYQRYRDRALTDLLKDLKTVCRGNVVQAPYLTPQESFALKAYLADIRGTP